MKDPIKIIHKFKNNNRKIQYKVYIFIGPIVPDEILNILETIKDTDLYTTFINLSKKNYNKLEGYYGEFWYYHFFINYHMQEQINNINNTVHKKKKLETQYGKIWFNKHISQQPEKKISYSFASMYYYDLLFNNKLNILNKFHNIDFRTFNNLNNYNPTQSKLKLKNKFVGSEANKLEQNLFGGGLYNDDDYNEGIQESDIDDDGEENPKEETKIISDDILEEEIENDLDLEEITKMYASTDIEKSKTILETSKLISAAIHDKKWEKNIDKLEIIYDNSLDNLQYDAKIENIYKKYYITDQYIFKNENIKTLRNKICISIPAGPCLSSLEKLQAKDKVKLHFCLLPETQYFWSEYKFETDKGVSYDYVMLGQKWIRRNELLKIDIIPNDNTKVYETLRDNLGYLKEYLGYKIKREDDESNIIRTYDNFITNNEIFMLDIYNELGVNYNPSIEQKKNLYDVYVNIYFPLISYDRLDNIIQLLGKQNNKEFQYIELQFNKIHIDLKLEYEIENIVEKTKLEKDKYNHLFSENHIIQSIIHVKIQNPKNITGTTSSTKYNLYRIFDNFIVNKTYPFIQYQTLDSELVYKFYTNSDENSNQELLMKWFENAPYGIAFKIKISDEKNKTLSTDKFISINLYESGRIEYKITWKEADKGTIEDIIKTYEYIKDLLKKINSENKKIKFILPSNDRFKYGFINTIVKFNLPKNFVINHNDLSEFSRYFYTYVSLVIDPKKREAKEKREDGLSKYGTYLRYKRINNYDNRLKLHLRILYFLRNYELNDRELIDEIAKQFNITLNVAAKELDLIREKYQKIIKKSKKTLKKLKILPRSKPPGIGIDIQGKEKDNYKIRITGARDKEQLEEILEFMQVLIYLYIETYLYQKKIYQKIKDKLKGLTKIAKRRNKVIDIVDYEVSTKAVKLITSLDKDRLGFKPDKGQNQWTRSCQNSGSDKKRRPQIISNNSIDELQKNGYKLNPNTKYYEKKINIKIKGKITSSVIKAIKLPDNNNSYNFYICDEVENKDYIYMGFLARGNNPNDLCMPCCFKKDQLTSMNKEKRNFFLKCLGENFKDTDEKTKVDNLGDKIYILQETNKLQDGRFIYLPKYLDIFLNKIWNNQYKIQNHYLLESKTGYFFKYTVKHEYYYFLIALSNIYNIDIEMIIQKFINFLHNDKNNVYFTYLNNGDIAESFKTCKAYIEYIKNSRYLEYDIVGELSAIPGVLSSNGIIYYMLTKHESVIKKHLEKDEILEQYFLESLNIENYNQLNEPRDIIILIKDNNYIFPIYWVQKDEKVTSSKNKTSKLIIQKYYSHNNIFGKIIEEFKKYYDITYKNNFINNLLINNNLIAKYIINIFKHNKINIVMQYIDDRHKCRYIKIHINNNNILVPTKPSGISYDLKFDNINTYLANSTTKLLDLNTTILLLKEIENLLHLDYKPKAVFYDIKKNDKIQIISILLNNNLSVPIFNEFVNELDIKKQNLAVIYQSLEETINQNILKYNNIKVYNKWIQNVKEHNYMTESYNLYRLELSLYLAKNLHIRDKIIDIVRNKTRDSSGTMSINKKKHLLRYILYKILNKKLSEQYKITLDNEFKLNHLDKDLNIKTEFGYITDNYPYLEDYEIKNVRDYCEINNTKDKCTQNLHCKWKNDSCKLVLLDTLAIDFVNKVIDEIIQDGIQFKELIQENEYYVSDIVDYSQFTNRPNQKIIKARNLNMNKLMSDLFGKENIPTIGKQKIRKIKRDIIDEIYPELIQLGKQFIQEIIPNQDSIIRAYINGYYWINNPLFNIKDRNLGYISDLQTTITYLFKANIIDFIQNILEMNTSKKNNETTDIKWQTDAFKSVHMSKNIIKFIKNYFNTDTNFFESALNTFRKTSFNTDGKVELFILSHLITLPIVVYDNFSNVKYLFLQGEIDVTPETIKKFTADDTLQKTIFLKFEYDTFNLIPKKIYTIYYL